MEIISRSLEETRNFVSDFLNKISNTSRDRATIVGLFGNLGSGKTTFVQSVAESWGVREHATSPTFVIMKRYTLHASRFANLIHIDAYRLKNGEELRKLGFEKLLADPANLILIEWAELVADILPSEHTKLFFEFIDDKTRKIKIEL